MQKLLACFAESRDTLPYLLGLSTNCVRRSNVRATFAISISFKSLACMVAPAGAASVKNPDTALSWQVHL